MLRWISALFSEITTFFSKMGNQHIVHVTLSPCSRERRQSLSLQRCGHLFARILESGATTASGVCFKRGSAARGSMMSVERTLKVERTSAEGVEAAVPCTSSSRQRLHSGIVVWMHVFAWMVDILNINFETLTGSNITNVWQEIFMPMTLAFSCEVVHEKLWKSVNICKLQQKNQWHLFFWTRCIVYQTNTKERI